MEDPDLCLYIRGSALGCAIPTLILTVRRLESVKLVANYEARIPPLLRGLPKLL
jgi:hypothetical protein